MAVLLQATIEAPMPTPAAAAAQRLSTSLQNSGRATVPQAAPHHDHRSESARPGGPAGDSGSP